MTLIEKIKKLVWYNSPSKLKEILLEISGSTFNPSEHDLDEFLNESANPYIRQDEIVVGDFIPLSGTTEGNPVTNPVEMTNGLTYSDNDLVPKSYVDAQRPYKKFVARISQNGTNHPTIIVLKNDLGTFTFDREQVGIYRIIFNNSYSVGSSKATMLITGGSTSPKVFGMEDLYYLKMFKIFSYFGNTLTDNFDTASLEIKVYN